MLNPPSAPTHPHPHPQTLAEVRAGDRVMRYRRIGSGRPVVLVGGTTAADSLWPELADALADHFRVIVPESPSCGADFACWLSDFVEGLGMSEVGLVASDAFCASAIDLVRRDADRIGRVVVVRGGAVHSSSTGPGAAPMPTGGIRPEQATSLDATPVPLLTVPRGLAGSEAIPLVTHFLADGDDGSRG